MLSSPVPGVRMETLLLTVSWLCAHAGEQRESALLNSLACNTYRSRLFSQRCWCIISLSSETCHRNSQERLSSRGQRAVNKEGIVLLSSTCARLMGKIKTDT